jgi:hypothetical protein
VDFGVKRVSAVTGRLTVRLHGRTETPSNGTVTALVDGDFRSSPVTADGRFFLERMPVGKHVLQATWSKGTCRVPVRLQPGAPPIFDAGELRCIADVLDPEAKLPAPDEPAWAGAPAPRGAAPDAGQGAE